MGDPDGGPGSSAAAPHDDPLWQTLRRAATASTRQHSTALRQQALALVPERSPERTEILADHARGLIVGGDPHGAEEVAAAVLAAVPESTLTAVRLRTEVTLAAAAAMNEGPHVVLPPLDAELERFAAGGHGLDADGLAELALAVADYSMVEVLGGDLQRAARTAAAAERIAATVPVSFVATFALSSAALDDGRFAEAARLADRCEELYATADEQMALAGYAHWAAVAYVRTWTGDGRRGLAVLDEARRATHLIDMPFVDDMVAESSSNALLALGRWDDALVAIDIALRAAERGGNHIGSGRLHGFAALIHARRGDVERAAAHLSAAGAFRVVHGMGAEHVVNAWATVARYAGDEPGALALLTAWFDVVTAHGEHCGYVPMRLDLMRLAIEARQFDLVEAVAALMLPVDPTVGRVHALVDGALALAAGDGDGLAQAAAILDDAMPFEAARLHHDAARCAQRAGDMPQARAEVRRGDALLAALGAAAERRALAEWAGPLGLAPSARRQTRPHGIDALTTAERRVARLVCDGHSNKEIGRTLAVSTRTIETHLSRIYVKLGVDSRLRLLSLARGGALFDDG